MTATLPHTRNLEDELADEARRALASLTHDPAECRDLGLMLGLFEVDPSGTIAKADPWTADPGDQQ